MSSIRWPKASKESYFFDVLDAVSPFPEEETDQGLLLQAPFHDLD